MVSRYRLAWGQSVSLASLLSTAGVLVELVGGIALTGQLAVAQITPDETLGPERSQIIPNFNGQPIEVITGGAAREQNLFHSFLQFSVAEGRGAYFFSPAGIENILARVTGNEPTNILGVLGTFGNATPDLFLSNPNGILFGPNSSLDVDGSFVATTANAIQFGDRGFFSATNPETPTPLLNVNPSAFLFNQVPAGNIISNSVAPVVPNSRFLGLRVPNGETLTLLGGNVSIDGGGVGAGLFAFGGRVEIAAVSGNTTIELNQNGSLAVPLDTQRADVVIDRGAQVDVSLNDGGDIAITARNIDLLESSTLAAGIDSRLGSIDSQAGDVMLDATEVIRVDNESTVSNLVFAGRTGNAGNIRINTGSLSVTNGGQLGAITFGQGNAGNILINARDRVSFTGTSTNGFRSGAFSVVQPGAVGQGGNIEINAGSLVASDRALLSASTLGQGDAGNIILSAQDSVSFLNDSSALSVIGQGAVGNGGNISVTTGSLQLTNGSQLDASIFEQGQGDAGDILVNAQDTVLLDGTSADGVRASTLFSEVVEGGIGNGGDVIVNTGSLFVSNGGRLEVSTEGQGDAGNVIVNARDIVSFDGTSRDGRIVSGALSNVVGDAEGNAGNVEITTGSLSVTNGAQLDASTEGLGNAGNIIIRARDQVAFRGVSPDGELATSVFSRIEERAVGDGGNIDITARTLSVTDGAQLQAQTLGQGNAGDVIINAAESVTLEGFDSRVIGEAESGGNLIRFFVSTIVSSTEAGANGDAGDVRITTGSLSLKNGGEIRNGTNAQGSAGNVVIEASEQVLLDGSASSFPSRIFSSVGSNGNGDGGSISINTGTLSLSNEAYISASTDGQGNAGNVLIDARDRVSLDTDAYIASVVQDTGNGEGGDIRINTGSLLISGAAQLDSSTFGQGNAGDVIIEARDRVSFTGSSGDGRASGILSTVESAANGEGGTVQITAGSLSLTDGAGVSASTRGQGSGGDVVVNVRDQVLLDRGGIISDVDSTGVGTSGNIFINASQLFLTNSGDLSSSTSGQGDAGTIDLQIRDRVSLNNGASISGTVEATAQGNGGDIRIHTGALSITNGAEIDTSTLGQGDAGDVLIEALESVSIAGVSPDRQLPSSILSIVGETGNGDSGSIRIQAESVSIRERSQVQASTYGQGSAGDIFIEAQDFVDVNEAIIYSIVGELPTGSSGNPATMSRDGGNVLITTGSLSMSNGAQLSSSTFGNGDAGDIIITARDAVSFTGVQPENIFPTAAFSIVGLTGEGNGGNIRVLSRSLAVTDGARLSASTLGQGNAGNLQIDAADFVLLDGVNSTVGIPSGLFSSTFESAGGRGGTIAVNTETFQITNGAGVDARTSNSFRGGDVVVNVQNLSLSDRAQIASSSQGTGQAGGVDITAQEAVTLTNSDITTAAAQASGGSITIRADAIRLNEDSDIRTNVERGGNNGGNIFLSADSILAFDDSDILAFSQDGQGGNVTLDTPAFFGENYQPAPSGTNPNTLDRNARVDVNASGAVAGVITLPDVSFIQNSLSELPETAVNPDSLIANSCIARSEQEGSFVVTGSGGLPERPGSTTVSPYPTGTVRSVSEKTTPVSEAQISWQFGDPIVEPQDVYRLADGRIVMSRKCSSLGN